MMRQIQSQSTHEANTEDTTRVPKLEVRAQHGGHKTNPRGHEMINKIRKHSPFTSLRSLPYDPQY